MNFDISFNRSYLHLVFGTFLLLVLNYLVPELSSNQENYYGLAKQYINPNWIPGSFSFTEFVGTRFLFQTLVGYPLQFMSFESVHLIFTTLGLLLLAIPVAKIFLHLGLGTVVSLVFMNFLFFSSIGNGAFWAGEWIFGGFEAKTPAYVFVLWSILFFLKGEFQKSILLTIPATYFHFLVGGYAFCFFASYTFLIERKYKETLKLSALYSLFIFPFVAFLYSKGYSGPTMIYEHGKSADWIYTAFRNPHHTAIFANVDILRSKVLPGILKASGCFIVLASLFWWKRNNIDARHSRLIKFSLYSLTILFLFLLVAYVDKEGKISKLYLFRFGAIAKFMSLLSLLLFIPAKLYRKLGKHGQILFVLIVFAAALIRFHKNFIKRYESSENNPIIDVAQKAREISRPGNTFLYLDSSNDKPDDGFESFIRHAERDLFVSYKFIPAEKSDMLEWYQRILNVKDLAKNPESIKEFLNRNPEIDYVITNSDLPLSLVTSSKNFKIYSR